MSLAGRGAWSLFEGDWCADDVTLRCSGCCYSLNCCWTHIFCSLVFLEAVERPRVAEQFDSRCIDEGLINWSLIWCEGAKAQRRNKTKTCLVGEKLDSATELKVQTIEYTMPLAGCLCSMQLSHFSTLIAIDAPDSQPISVAEQKADGWCILCFHVMMYKKKLVFALLT